ncbi:MAG: sigma-70 family RNA polymerase sigma factor, partial [Bdellovibrionales bacterium]|nr:sigma-70 family RNA polymerase sigma factor [Bdellovibrionales bacterium]NQZ19120.1 sigma-70 family RNA polymerase sigma factor [Bdellovibrionales bacterium]
GEGKLKAWLLQITRNTCFSLFRDLKKNKSEDVSEHEIEDVSQNDILDLKRDQETKRKLKTCIERLPDQQRFVLVIWMTEDKTYEEIAHHMNLTVSSVKSLLFRSRQKLKEMMN